MQQDTVHLPTPQQDSVPQQPEVDPREDTVREGAPRVLYTDSSREEVTAGASQTSKERKEQPSSKHSLVQQSQGGQPLSSDHCPQLPQGLKEGQRWNHQWEPTSGRRSREAEGRESGERRESRTLPRDRERRERSKLQRDEYTTSNRSSGRDAILDGNAETIREYRKGGEQVRPREGERTRNRTGSFEGESERRCATRYNENRRRLRISPSEGTDEREEEREECLENFWDCYRAPNWERPRGELEDNFCRYAPGGRDYTDTVWPQGSRSGGKNIDWTTDGTATWETSEQAERVEEDWGRQTSEPWYKSSMERSPIPNLTRGEKTQTRVSGNNGDDEQLFIPLGGGTEGRSGEAHTGVRGEVVQSDIHGEKEKRKVEEDTGLQSSERGSAGKAFQDGLPGDSCGTPGGERLDDHPRHIECLSTCQSGRAIQSLSVLQLSRSLLLIRGDAIWSKGRAQSIHEDNETGSVTYQRTVEGKAGDISGRYSPYASRQGCLEIDLTGDSPVPEKSGLDTVGGEAEARTRKERRVFGMAVELREDGSDTPRKEESAAPGGCAKMDSTCKEKEETEDEGLSSTPRKVELRETTTPTSKFVDEAHAIRTEAGNSPRGLERNCDSQSNDTGRINALEKNPAREQAKESEEKEQTSRTYNGRIRAGMGCSINNINREQRGEDICSRELDPPGERVSDKREGVQSSVEDFGKERSMAERTENRPYSSEDRQHVHEMDNPEEERSAIAHSNTESIGEETEQPGHHNSNGTPPGRTEHGSGCTQPDGEKAGLCTEGGESRRDITNNRTENTRYNFRSDCAGALREYLETILREKEERERNTRRRHSASPPVPEKHWTNLEREDEGSPEGTNDSDSATLAGADLDPVTAAWAFDRGTGDLSGEHDTGSEDEKGRLETTPRRGDSRHTGQENIQGRDLFLTWGEYVGAREIAAAILRSQKSERDTWRALRRFKQFLDRESMDDTDPLTTKDAKWIMAEFIETLSNTNLSSGVIYQTVLKVLESINLFRETKIDRKDIEIFLKTYVGDKPRRGKRYKSMWDLTIITRWAESTYDSKDIRTLQRRALILTMIFGALRPAELERMRRETTTFKDNSIQTQVRTKTSGGEIIKVIIRKHPNPRIDAVEALQHWMDYTKTTFKSEHVWFDIKEMQPASLQKIKEELTAILRENEIPESFTAYSIRHAVITHLARQEGADWKVINAYARWAPGSRVGQEYYTVLPVQDTNWILETIGGSVSQRGEDYKIDKMGDMKEGTLEISETEMKDRANELPKAGFGIRKKLTRKRSRGRMNLQSGEERRSETTHSRSSTPRQPSPQKTPSIIPSNICELTGEKDPTPLKKRGKDRRKHSGRSIAQIGDNTEGVTTGPMSPQRYPKKERA